MRICECGEGKPHIENGELLEDLEKEIKKIQSDFCNDCDNSLNNKICSHCSHYPFIHNLPIGDYFKLKGD